MEVRVGSPEYWAVYEAKDTAVKPKYQAQIRDIQAKLERGTYFIKHGHRVRGINPDAILTEVPLSERQRERLKWNLKVLVFRSVEGYPGTLGFCLPDHLSRENPQSPSRAWDYNKTFTTNSDLSTY